MGQFLPLFLQPANLSAAKETVHIAATKMENRIFVEFFIELVSSQEPGGAPAAASSCGLLRAGVQLLLNKAGEVLKPLKGRGGKLTWTGVDQAQRARQLPSV